ncbi:MAG TPA: hypothetical protein VLI42_03170, partial [Chthoniobacterales bacterium]|nr:hypothetical protein [Chthoniobacterales bacterium]
MDFRPDAVATRSASFQATRWTLILAAAGDDGTASQAHRALSELCRIYWRPLYFFLRREGHSAEDAQDLTQGFFLELVRDRMYMRAQVERGRFRSFLLGALRHFTSDSADREHAQKRGGGQMRETFDDAAIAEVEAQVAGSRQWSASALYDREWAAALLRQTLDRLAEECRIAGKSGLFEGLRPYFVGASDDTIPYAEISRRLHRAAGTLRSD